MGGRQKLTVLLGTVAFLAGCDGNSLDFDFRDRARGFDTSSAAQNATADRPTADNRGIISYPNYQIAVAQRGDTVGTIAQRIGLGADELARFNGLTPTTQLRANEVLALPRRVAEPLPGAAGSIQTGVLEPGAVDIATLAGDAINRASPSQPGVAPTAEAARGVEPIRHKVERGETAFTISRLYNVSVRSLAEWNGLGSDLTVREGQYLLIPVVIDDGEDAGTVAAPGTGSATPEPPSAGTALPAVEATPTVKTPESPQLAAPDPGGKLLMPVRGNIIRDFQKGKNDGIDIAAAGGSSVVAAGDGTVAAITRDTNQVPILVIRHTGSLLTVYAGVDKLSVAKGDKVKRGQKIAVVRDANPSFLHFEVRNELVAEDPMDFFN